MLSKFLCCGAGCDSGSDAPIDATSGVIWNITYLEQLTAGYLSTHGVVFHFQGLLSAHVALMCLSRLDL